MTHARQTPDIRIKRAYEAPSSDDGARILIDRLWPRGLRKDDASLAQWMKEVAPSDPLRRWFGHDPARWAQFRRRYASELDGKQVELGELRDLAKHGPVTLVYAAHDVEHNHALVLRDKLLH